MSQQATNPFSITPNEDAANAGVGAGSNSGSETNPFQMLENVTEVKSPFAGVGERSPFGLVDSAVGQPAKIPVRKPDFSGSAAQALATEQPQHKNPFEVYQEHRSAGKGGDYVRLRPEQMYSANAAPQPFFVVDDSEQVRSPFSAHPREQRDSSKSQNAAQPKNHRSGGMKQLELRAIFGVNHELTPDEILDHARDLPGIRNVSIVGDEESHAVSILKDSIARLSSDDSDVLSLSVSSGNVDFINEGDCTLAILHEGDYDPGVREKLIIVTRELGRAS